MRTVGRIKQLFWLAAILQFLMSATILFMPFATRIGEQNRILAVLLGAVFWISAILGYTLLIIANAKRKGFIRSKIDGNVKMNCRAGIIEFFSNIPATIADVTMILSLLLFIIVGFTSWRYEYIAYLLLFFFAFSFNMHCMFNGRIYKATKIRRIRRNNNV